MGWLPRLQRHGPTTEDRQSSDSPASSEPDVEKRDDVDNVQADIAVAVENADPALEKRVLRKLDWNIMPIVFVLCTSRLTHADGEIG